MPKFSKSFTHVVLLFVVLVLLVPIFVLHITGEKKKDQKSKGKSHKKKQIIESNKLVAWVFHRSDPSIDPSTQKSLSLTETHFHSLTY